MFPERTSVGLDVHARSVLAHATDELTGEVHTARLPAGSEVATWILALPGPIAALYEAGPTGFGLARELRAAGVRCEVAAPTKLPRPVGDRVKTDARDAALLCRVLRLGEYVPVAVPDAATEAARDLVRCREDCRTDLSRSRHRLSKMLLRQRIVYADGTTWNVTHTRWLERQRFNDSTVQWIFDEYLDQVMTITARRKRLDRRIEELASDSAWTPVVRRLCCLRGISTLTGFALAVEIGDWTRFDGNSIGAYLGLTPSERSSGKSRALGGITQTGNSHVRRLLIEAGLHHLRPYRRSPKLRARWELASPAARTRADAGNRRLYERWMALEARGKRRGVSRVAIARELAGWCWSLATIEP
ncbi:IS110 family transposase ISCARN28 [Propionicimonas sp. T2.31MG-18]